MFWVFYCFCNALTGLLGSQGWDEPICNFGNSIFTDWIIAEIRGIYLAKKLQKTR